MIILVLYNRSGKHQPPIAGLFISHPHVRENKWTETPGVGGWESFWQPAIIIHSAFHLKQKYVYKFGVYELIEWFSKIYQIKNFFSPLHAPDIEQHTRANFSA